MSTSDSHHSAMNPGCLKKSLYIGIWFPEMCASQARCILAAPAMTSISPRGVRIIWHACLTHTGSPLPN